MKKASLLLFTLLLLISCTKEVKVDFSEEIIETSEGADIAFNFPKATGTAEVTKRINQTLENHIVKQINVSESETFDGNLYDAVAQFNHEYQRFKNNFPEAAQPWEAFIDGEITYRSPEIISIAITSYLDTGGAHGNSSVRFFNFNPQTGEQLLTNDLLANTKGISEVIKEKLITAIKAEPNSTTMEDVFFGKDFQLPETLGYSDEGLIILYNPYEIASYSQGIVEFTIPYEAVTSFLKIN
ncbi:DUF3298 and DUF4163 domain-containing protein [Psychroserpens damuponensis]|uniref:DUF3298 and DUF4163 domain-containing protein n=1 Tax=Psychroserpens damuponensis TaxID=943936 RepID=UPI00058DE0E0|nr:DUF3298 and DUF4163 domain-containing protein [Psychroserpens damuponensis]